MKTILTTLIFFLGIFAVKAQNYGEIHGKILDHATGNPILFATVSTEYGGKLIGTTTDDEGRFKLKPLQPGTYTVQVNYLGYNPRSIENIEVTSGKIYFLGTVDISTNNELVEFEVVGHKLIDVDEPNTLVIKAAELKHNALIKSPAKLIGSLTPELKTDENGQFLVRGSRAGTTATYLDGMRLTGGLGNLSGSAIKSISVYTGGIPAKYGDITGGVVVIETKSYFDYFYDQNSR